MKKALILAVLFAASFCFAQGKTEVSDKDIKMMEEMGLFDEMDKDMGSQEKAQGQGMSERRPDQIKPGMNQPNGMNREQPNGMNREQPNGMNREQPNGMNREQPKPGANPEQTKEAMEATMLARIKTELELTPEQAGKFTESFYKSQELMQEYAKNKMIAMKELKTAVQAEKVDEGTLNGMIENVLKFDRELAEKQKETREKTMAMLNTKQKAKMLLVEGYMQAMFQPNMRRAVKNEMKK